jgi:ribosomal protein S6
MEENETQVEVSDNSVYEVGFHLVPDITEEKLPEAFGNIKEVLTKSGATVISEEFPKLTTLAYTMEKTINNKIERFRDGNFGWIKFEVEGAEIAKIDAALRLRTDVIRHLIVTTVRENTIASKRAPSVRRRTTEGGEATDAPEMSKAEIDREIEALVETKASETPEVAA